MKNDIYIPQTGDGLYEELFEQFKLLFWQPALMRGGFVIEPDAPTGFAMTTSSASQIVDKYGLCVAVLEVDYYNSNIAPLFINNPSLLCMVWIILKIQPDNNKATTANASLFEEIIIRELNKEKQFIEKIQTIIKKWRLESLTVRKIANVSDLLQEVAKDVKKLEKRCANQLDEIQKNEIIIKELKERCSLMERENAQLEAKVKSEDFRKKIGEDYLIAVFEEFFKEVDEWDFDQRIESYHVLSLFLDFSTVPTSVKKKIRALNKRTGSKGTTVIAQPGSTINNNDIHDNGTVNTNKAD